MPFPARHPALPITATNTNINDAIWLLFIVLPPEKLGRSVYHRHHTRSQGVHGTHYLHRAVIDTRRQDWLKFLEPLNADLHILPNRVFERIAGCSLTLSDCGLDK